MWLLWKLRTSAFFGICFTSVAAAGQIVTDGDTLRMEGKTYRLFGIDAPERAQICSDGWPAGRLAGWPFGRDKIAEADFG